MPFLGFLTASFVWLGIPSAFIWPRWAAIAVLLPLVSRLDPRMMAPSFLAAFVGVLGYAALSLLWSADPLGGTYDFACLLMFGLVAVAAAGLPDIDRTMTAITCGVAISSVLCLFQIFGWSPVRELGRPPAGLFLNRDFLAESAAILLVWNAVSRRWLLASLMAIPVALCQSRVALIAASAGFFVAAGTKMRLLAAALTMTAAAIVFLNPEKIASGAQRLSIWGLAVRMFSLWGSGFGGFAAAYPGFEYAHSDLLQFIAELGMGSVFVGFVIVVLVRAKIARAHRAALAAVLAECAIAFPLHLPTTAFMAAVLAGGAVRRRVRICGIRDSGADDGREHLWADPLEVASRYASRKSRASVSARSPIADHPH